MVYFPVLIEFSNAGYVQLLNLECSVHIFVPKEYPWLGFFVSTMMSHPPFYTHSTDSNTPNYQIKPKLRTLIDEMKERHYENLPWVSPLTPGSKAEIVKIYIRNYTDL